jgi:hypothetical protein
LIDSASFSIYSIKKTQISIFSICIFFDEFTN